MWQRVWFFKCWIQENTVSYYSRHTTTGIDYCKTQLRGSRCRRQVANYCLAMTQLHSILERFAAQDLRSFLFQKGWIYVVTWYACIFSIALPAYPMRRYSYRYICTSALPRLTIRILTEYYCTYSVLYLTCPAVPPSVPCPQNPSKISREIIERY